MTASTTTSSYGVRSSVAPLQRVAVRRPLTGGADVVAQYEAAHWQTPDLDRLAAQHAGFVQTLRDLGSEVVELDPGPGLPDAVFVYDPVFVGPSGSIELQAAKAARVGESTHLIAGLESAGDGGTGAERSASNQRRIDSKRLAYLDEPLVQRAQTGAMM